jgi:hypothetical protein
MHFARLDCWSEPPIVGAEIATLANWPLRPKRDDRPQLTLTGVQAWPTTFLQESADGVRTDTVSRLRVSDHDASPLECAEVLEGPTGVPVLGAMLTPAGRGSAVKTKHRREREADKSSEWRGRFSEY